MILMFLFRSIMVLLLLWPLCGITAQHSEKLWSLLTLNGDYGKVVYYVEPQLRLVYQNNLFQQFLTNAGLGYKVASNWQVWFGETFSADSQDTLASNLDEYRLWQQVIWKKQLPRLAIITRTRFEERKSLFFSEWGYRLRHRTLLNIPVANHISLVAYNEMFLNMNKTNWIITDRFDQNRAYLGIEQRLSKNTYFGVGYVNQFLSTPRIQFNNVVALNWRIDMEN